jgi:hypothetical protein
MLSKLWLHLATVVLVLALGAALFLSWRADLLNRAQLASELAATKQLVTAADVRQHDRDTQLQQTLAALATEKRTVVTRAQIVKDLPSAIPLPAPITLQATPPASTAPNAMKPSGNRRNYPCPRPQAPVRLQSQLPGLPSQTLCLAKQPRRRANENRRPHQRTRRRLAHRQRWEPPPPHHARRQIGAP